MKRARRHSRQPEPGEQADAVVFRRWPRPVGGGIVALFPDLPASEGLVTSYEHVGQHGAADYQHVLRKTDPVETSVPDQERDELLDELRSTGYRPILRQRRSRHSR